MVCDYLVSKQFYLSYYINANYHSLRYMLKYTISSSLKFGIVVPLII